jgi:hypothetical protein
MNPSTRSVGTLRAVTCVHQRLYDACEAANRTAAPKVDDDFHFQGVERRYPFLSQSPAFGTLQISPGRTAKRSPASGSGISNILKRSSTAGCSSERSLAVASQRTR